MPSYQKKTEKGSENYKMSMDELKRKPLPPKENLYPTDQLEGEDREKSPSKDKGSPLKDISNTEADSSAEKSNARHRRGDKDTGAPHATITHERKQIEEKQGSNWICAVILASFAIIAVIFGLRGLFTSSSPSQSFDINKVMQGIKQKFPGQPDMTYRIVKSEINTAISEKKLSPGIILLLASKEAQDINNRFALYLAESVFQQSDYIPIKSDEAKSFHVLKEEIDNIIKSKLKENENKIVLVNELTKFPFEAALMFHSYCDHENAPFKNALYVITISSNDTISVNEGKQWDALATKYLKAAWKDSEYDQVSSLISRLTGNVALIVGKS